MGSLPVQVFMGSLPVQVFLDSLPVQVLMGSLPVQVFLGSLPVHDVLIQHCCVASQVELAEVEEAQGQVGHHKGEAQQGVGCGTAF